LLVWLSVLGSQGRLASRSHEINGSKQELEYPAHWRHYTLASHREQVDLVQIHFPVNLNCSSRGNI